MFLKNFSAQNFKSLEKVQVEFQSGVNLIVGPNAVGKTTVLDAIRFVKALLVPRTNNETFQTLLSLGATTHFDRMKIICESLAANPSEQISIHCVFKLHESELQRLQSAIPRIAENTLRKQMNFGTDLSGWINFISNFQGISLLKQFVGTVTQEVETLNRSGGLLKLGVTITPKTGQIEPDDPSAPAIFAFFEDQLPPRLTHFSYFPADRALPRGEQQIQIGSQDAGQTLESHSSQAELKYSRIKNLIFNSLLNGDAGRKEISDDFSSIFNSVLKGRVLAQNAFGVNDHGQFSIRISDLANSRTFDIDHMSSGEKSLILTFLVIKRSVVDNGMILLDEPELHLNPAVCGDVLHFLADECVRPKSLQVIGCTHSPEIVAAAFGRDDCHIYHLESGTSFVRVRREDDAEISDALTSLGTTEAETLLYPSTLFVEGVSDVDILEAGYSDLLRRRNVKDLGGRGEVENSIKTLQTKERAGKTISSKYFLFDKDRMPTDLKSTPLVRLKQLPRRCIENYLLDIDALDHVLNEQGACAISSPSLSRLEGVVKGIALSQLDGIAIREVYGLEPFNSVGVRSTDIQRATVRQAADVISEQISAAKIRFHSFDATSWKEDFVVNVAKYVNTCRNEWEENWATLCDGKQVFDDLRRQLKIRVPLPLLKTRLIREMKIRRSVGWIELQAVLIELFSEFSASETPRPVSPSYAS